MLMKHTGFPRIKVRRGVYQIGPLTVYRHEPKYRGSVRYCWLEQGSNRLVGYTLTDVEAVALQRQAELDKKAGAL